MEVKSILETIMPANAAAALIGAIMAVVLMTEFTKEILKMLEDYLEEKKGKQIKFFDHTKILLSIFWSVIIVMTLTLTNVFSKTDFVIYFFMIIGASNVFYELILKKLKKILDGE